METFLLYLGKSALAAGAFYLAYLILFQNKKHFTFNRLYLPVSLALSFVIPLITFTRIRYIEAAPVQVFEGFAYVPETVDFAEKPEIVWEWYQYLFAIYILGCAGFLFHLLFGHFKAVSIVRKSVVKMLFGAKVHVSGLDIHPFSFFTKIVLSKNTLNNPNLELIVRHENIHVQEKHTIDILVSELLFLAQWFNPFAWLIKDAIKNNLEYKTDAQVVKNSNPQEYQLAMVGLADKKGVAPFLTALNGSQLKNRIIMMKKKTENKHAFVKQLLVLPLLAILVMGLSNKEVKTEIIQPEIEIDQKESKTTPLVAEVPVNSENLVNAPINFYKQSLGSEKAVEDYFKKSIDTIKAEMFESITANNTENTSSEAGINIVPGYRKKDSVFYKVEEMPKFPGGEAALKKYIERSIKYPEIALENGIQGKVYVSFVVDKNGNVTDTKIVRGVDPSLDKEALRVASTLPKWKPGKEKGEIVNVMYTVPVDFKPTIEQLRKYNKTELEDKLLRNHSEKHTVNGKVTDHDGNAIAGANILIKGKTIGTITNLKGEYLLEIPNEQETLVFSFVGFSVEEIPVEGKSEINVQLNADKNSKGEITVAGYPISDSKKYKHKISGQVTNENGEPIPAVAILIKGKTVGTISDGDGKFEIGDTERIETLVFSMVGYELKSVQPVDNKELNVVLEKDEKNESAALGIKSPRVTKILQYENSDVSDAIYLVDGMQVNNLAEIDPESIEKIDVLKGESAKNMFGDKGKNGVVLITTKKSAQVPGITTGKLSIQNKNYPGDGEPMFVVNGKISEKNMDELDPSEIHSVSVLKDESAVAKFGENAKNGVISITTKDFVIQSVLELRKYIARNIYYPKKAQTVGKEGTYYLTLKILSDGGIASVEEASKEKVLKTENRIDEVVVTAYSVPPSEKLKSDALENYDELFVQAIKRVFENCPPIDIDEYKGKEIVVSAKFMLQ